VVAADIWELIGNGQFSAARARIAEATATGRLAPQEAARMARRLALLHTRLGELPARLQHVEGFPSQLREHTLFQIQRMLEARDFHLATEAQLKRAKKLIEQRERLMAK
jgi:hypothetical protein